MSVLDWILTGLLAIALGTIVGLLISNIEINQNQYQEVRSYNINQNANVNIVNSGVLSGKIRFEITNFKDLSELSNFLIGLEIFQSLNLKIYENIKNNSWLVFYPVLDNIIKTNSMTFSNFQSNSMKIGVK